MSAIAPQTRGEVAVGVASGAAHLQCPLCGHFSKSHAHQLTHVAAAHPARLDGVTVGRLGNILMYQNTARLFHCSDCFFTSRDFNKLYKHIISRHCEDHRGGEEEEGLEKKGREEGEEQEKTREEGEEQEKGREEGEEQEKTMKEGEEQKKTREEGEEQEKGSKEGEEQEKGSEEGEEQEKTKEGEEMRKEAEKQQMKMREEGEEQEKVMKGGEEQEKTREEGEEQEENNALKRSSEEARDESVLMFDGAGYHCLICGWKTKLKALGVNHVVRKHDIPKAYASQAIRRDVVAPRAPEEEEGGAGLSGEQLKEEMAATAKVVRFISNRFVCLLCGWKTKLKGFAISHVVRCHDVERPYGCRSCSRCFFLPSRLQQHVRAAHRPGRYACPFCCFRSHFLGGFRRHCSRCNARGEGEGGEEEEEEERKERRGVRKRKTERVMEEEDDDD